MLLAKQTRKNNNLFAMVHALNISKFSDLWGFARRGTHLYAHDFALALGFLLYGKVYRKTNKQTKKQKPLKFLKNELKFPPSVCANIFVTLL